MRFSEQPPSKQWASLKYQGQKLAEVWFKPEGEPYGLVFRIPRESLLIPVTREQFTLENLLKAVAIVPDEVESWHHGDDMHAGMEGSNPQFRTAIALPPQEINHLEIHVRIASPEAVVHDTSQRLEISAEKWQDLENRWRSILGLEASMDSMRISMESLLMQMESEWKKPMTIEQKSYAPRADVALWNKAKSRVLNAIPKMKDYIHRSTWAMGLPERKRLAQLYSDNIQPRLPFPQIDEVMKQLEELRKDRQVLGALGASVYQECKGISAELQGALRALHTNAALAQKKKNSAKTR